MEGTISLIISNLLSSLERLSQFMPIFTSLAASSSSSSSSTVEEEMIIDVNSMQEGLMEDLSRLLRILQRIQALLHDAAKREVQDKQTKLWLSELRKVAYDAEDVLDQYDYQIIKTQVEGMTTTEEKPSLQRKKVDDDDDDFYGDQVCLLILKSIKILVIRKRGDKLIMHDNYDQVSPPSSNSIKIPISCDMAMRIIEIIKKFDEISNDRKALQLREENAPRRPCFNDVMKRPPSSSLVRESEIFGREEEKKKIIQLLMSHEKENIVIPIVGMGGVGKTTIVQLIYNDPVVCQNFYPKVWVCVSEEFDVLRVTKEIVISIMGSSIHNDNNNLNDLQCILKKALLDKKFLLILDDVWNERPEMWEVLRAPFFGIGMGKIIVTTRSMLVARIMQTVSPLELECLNKEMSWLLFQRHAFCGWELDQQLNFEQLGRIITNKCGGLPLALKVIGGFLRYEVDDEIWMDVSNNNLGEIEDTKNFILPALRISYSHLPSYLKPCFLYASLFPKNYYFKKVELTRMWIAQGYIQPTRRKRLLEDIAFEFFEDLVKRSFFQWSKYVKCFTLHDMVHDLAHSITRNEIFSSLDFDTKNIPKDAKHIFIQRRKINQISLGGAIRTLYIDPNIFSTESLFHLSCLRVLRFHAPIFECNHQFVVLIGSMHQLRYLSIHAKMIQMTENSLGNLYKLQILILLSSHINMIPPAFGKLINLRHLIIQTMNEELVPRSYFGSKNLLTLNFTPIFDFYHITNEFVASEYQVRKDGQYSSIRWLKPLMNLRGSLDIYGLENVVDFEDAKNANLQSKPYIESLKLVWANIKYDECARNDEAVLEGLEPHTNLKNLSIDGYSGNCFPNWFGNPYFYNLSNIRLTSFQIKEECKFLPLFKLPSLKSLKIEKNKEITKMGQDFWCYNAPSEGHENYSTEAHVDFHSSKNMKNKSFLEWKEHRMVKSGNFLSLKYLHIFYCKKLQQISTLPSTLEEFSVDHCERLEYIALPFSSRYLPRLQKVDIYLCHILKSVINLNNLLGTLKVLKLGNCYLLEPNPDEDYDLSYGRVSSEKGIGHVTECPGMREWCQRHGFTYQEDSDNSYDKDCQELDSIKEAILNWSRQRKV
ncbi:disease resistance protein RGA2-like isoform X2 [Dendrobium catenatum]|uniref:disease resistance protein RGA2-like isoform X2 n=1 Tax=Dendrobium catenatum TaxID=906689 RepID=UPI00109EF3E0|nr:disease resistance protein RGA2-like isoform X2 [Dendrobium catenatum]